MNWRPLSPHLPSSAARLHHRQAWCHPASMTRNNDWCGIFNQKAGYCYWMNHISCIAANSWDTISGEGRFNMGRGGQYTLLIHIPGVIYWWMLLQRTKIGNLFRKCWSFILVYWIFCFPCYMSDYGTKNGCRCCFKHLVDVFTLKVANLTMAQNWNIA